MKNYIIKQLTQTSAWIGLILVIGAVVMPRSWILFMGLILIITDDKNMAAFFARLSPSMKKWIDDLGA